MNNKTYQFEIINISYINGERTPIDYDYRKTQFETEDELIDYKKYIQNKLNKRLYFSTRDLRDRGSKPKGCKHLKVTYVPKETKESNFTQTVNFKVKECSPKAIL